MELKRWKKCQRVIHKPKSLPLIVLMVLFTRAVSAGIIDFETLPDASAIADSTSITTQFPGLIFQNGTVISAGISLNEAEFPPHSGTNVIFDDGGPITIVFGPSISNFSGYFTYADRLTIEAFDVADQMIASVDSLFSNNEALSGDTGSSPNELIQLTSSSGISSVTITSDPAGVSFVMDDIGFTDFQITPEPSSVYLIILGAAALLVTRTRRS